MDRRGRKAAEELNGNIGNRKTRRKNLGMVDIKW